MARGVEVKSALEPSETWSALGILYKIWRTAQSNWKGGLGGGSGSLCFESRASAPPRGLLVSEHRGVTTLRRHDRVGA